MQFLAYLAVMIVGSLIAYALAPKPPKQKPPTLDDFDLPTAEEGRSIPWIFGTYKITDPNFIWYGDLEVRTRTKDKVKTRLYRMGTQQEFCISPVDALVALEYGGKDCGITEVTASGQISINLPDLFGGRDKEGGIDGDFDVCFGEPTQAVNDYLLAQLGAPLSAFRDSLTLVGRKPSWVANSTYIKPLLPTVRCTKAGWADGACWYPETCEINGEGSYPYSDYCATQNFDNWWKLSEAFPNGSSGSTGANSGTGTATINRKSVYLAGDADITAQAPYINLGTDDGKCVTFHESLRLRGMLGQVEIDGTSPFSLWAWFTFDEDLDRRHIFCSNAKGELDVYHGVFVTALSSGQIQLSFGDGFGKEAANRYSYVTIEDTPILQLGALHFIVLNVTPSTTASLNEFELWVDNVKYDMLHLSGSATTTEWPSGAIWYGGCPYEPPEGFASKSFCFVGQLDEPGAHMGYLTPTQIGFMDLYGRTPSSAAGIDMNPAHIIYKVITDTDQGLAEPSATIDDTSFRYAASVFYSERLGLSTQWRNEGSARDFIAEVCKHAGAVLSLDPSTGLTQLIPLRDDYDVDSLDVITEAHTVEVVEWQDAADGEAVNEVTVTFRQRNASNGTATWTNRASVQAAGRVHETMPFPMIPHRALATRIAKRETMQRSSNLSRGKIKVNRTGWDKLPGAVFVFSHAPEGIEAVVVRVIDIDTGTLTDGAITISVIQDIFSLDDTLTDIGSQDGEWAPPNTTPAAATAQAVLEAPYWQLLGDLGAAETAAQAPGAGYVVPLIGKPTALSTEFNAWARISPNAYAETVTGAAFAPTATLTAALDRSSDSDIALTAPVDLDLVEPGWIVVIGTGAAAELCYVALVDATLAEISVLRARMDTTPQLHAAGTRVWFLDASALDWPRIPDEFADADVVDVKAQTATDAGLLDISAATAASITLDSRQVRPYPPGNIEINGEAHPTLLEAALTVTWAHRDRLAQGLTLVSQYDATDYGPEAGTTYNAYAYDDSDDTLLDSDTAIAGATWSPTIAISCTLRIEIESTRDGYVSWQRQVRIFDYIATSAILTEASEYLLTETGDYLITET